MDFSNAICSVQMHCNSASLHESSATNGSATNLNARAKLHYQSKPSSFTISCVKMSSAWLCCKSQKLQGRQVNPKKPQNPNCQVISVQTESMQCHTAVEQGDHTLNLQTNTLLAASKKSKVHQKVIKSSSKSLKSPFRAQNHQKFIKSSSKVHQKCNAARVKLHLLETVFN